MDSKLMRKTVFLALFLMLLVGSVVVAANWSRITGRMAPATVATSEENEITQKVDANGMIEGADLSAFMQDGTFFDEKQTVYSALLEKQETESKTLSLIATSVEKDLRVQVVDGQGALATGHGFHVNIQRTAGSAPSEEETDLEPNEGGIVDKNIGLGPNSGLLGDKETAYKDLDQDGIIYIGGLKAGDYMVSLEPVQGYEISDVSMRVTVKDKVEYKIIDDISLLIKTEDEIDPSIEDTGVQEAGEDTDGTEDSKIKQPDGKTRFGIDVSKWNKEIDWKRVKDAGVSFAIIRCGYRGSSSGVLVEDPYFIKNVEGALANNIQVGLYFFTQAINEVEAVEEASMVLSLSREYGLEYPIFIDTEGAGGNGRADHLDMVTRTAVCEAFCKTIREAKQDAGIYASRNWLNQNLDMTKLDDNVIWLAEYRSAPKYEGKHQLWQYTSNGKIDGIEGRVDLNLSYLGY